MHNPIVILKIIKVTSGFATRHIGLTTAALAPSTLNKHLHKFLNANYISTDVDQTRTGMHARERNVTLLDSVQRTLLIERL